MQEGSRYSVTAINSSTYAIADMLMVRAYVLQIIPISSPLANVQFILYEEEHHGQDFSIIIEEILSFSWFAINWNNVIALGTQFMSQLPQVHNLSNPIELYSAFGGLLLGDSYTLPKPVNKDHH